MGMGWHTLSHPRKEILSSRPCKCGAGKVREINIIEEESEYPPFERGYTYLETDCPFNCENIK